MRCFLAIFRCRHWSIDSILQGASARLPHSVVSSLCGFLTLWLLHSAASLVYDVFHYPSAISFDHYIECLPILTSTPTSTLTSTTTSTLTSTTTSTLTSTSLTSHIKPTHSHLPSFHLLLRQSVHPMAKYLDLPPEIRQLIYNALLVNPKNNKSRIVYTSSDGSGSSNWSRTLGSPAPSDESAVDGSPTPIKSSISQIGHADLWSLARANKLLYAEVTPIMYSHAQLKYTSGDLSDAHTNSTLLHNYLEKLSPTTSRLYRTLTIVCGHLSGKDMRLIVDLINLRLPKLRLLSIRAINPAIEGWPRMSFPALTKGAYQIMAAARPVARLTSRPVLSIKPRYRFYLKHEPYKNDPDYWFTSHLRWSMMLGSPHSLMRIGDWRREIQNYHETAWQHGDYLLLTSFLRSTLAEAAETDDARTLDEMESKLANHQEVLSRIKEHEVVVRRQNFCLHRLRI